MVLAGEPERPVTVSLRLTLLTAKDQLIAPVGYALDEAIDGAVLVILV
jgi:hypothetical protein